MPDVSESKFSIQFIRNNYANTKRPSETVQKIITLLWINKFIRIGIYSVFKTEQKTIKLKQRQLLVEMNPWHLSLKYVVLQEQIKVSSVISMFAISFTHFGN